MRLARKAVARREFSKNLLVRCTDLFRRAYRDLADQATAEGALSSPAELYYLTHEELGRLLVDGEVGLRLLAQGRHRAASAAPPISFPRVFVAPLEGDAASSGGEQGDDAPVLRGRPVSRGVAVGRARVVSSIEDGAQLQPGEILVAPMTDVGWSPYFPMLAGIATDLGSAISHGAVVAREYGLPAVVNLGNATARIRTGDKLRLDGDRGTVEILERAESGDSEGGMR